MHEQLRPIHRAFVGRIVRPLFFDVWKGMHLAERTATLVPTERGDRDALARGSIENLRRLCAHAYTEVPFYRRLGPLPSRDRDLGRWLAEQPPLTRADLVGRAEDLITTRPLSAPIPSASGGSTGAPVRFVVDEEYLADSSAVELRFFAWAGHHSGEPIARLWGHPGETMSGRQGWRGAAKTWLLADRLFDAFTVNADRARAIVEGLRALQPSIVLGYTSSLCELARLSFALELELPVPRAVFSSAETLHAHQRELLASAFAAPVFDRYGTREIGAVACECHVHRGLHYSPLRHVLEVVRPDGSACDPGEEGDLLVTVLTNLTQPFIRYAIGDRAVLAPPDTCACGRTWPRLERIAGRVVECLVGTNGTLVTPEFVIHMLGVEMNKGLVARFQVEQDHPGRVEVRIVPGRNMTGQNRAAFFGEVAAMLRHVLGQDMRVNIVQVDSIPSAASGKFRYVVNTIARTAGGPS